MKNSSLVKILLVTVFAILPLTGGFAQTGLWNKLAVNYELNKKWGFESNIQARTKSIGSPMSSYIGEIGSSYNLQKNLSLSLGYRNTNKPDDESDKSDKFHRFQTELKLKNKVSKKLKVNYRLRYQKEYKQKKSGKLKEEESLLRLKSALSYKTKRKFEPYISTELSYEPGKDLENLRYKTGCEFEIKKWMSLDLAYQIDDPLFSKKESKYRIAWALSFNLK